MQVSLLVGLQGANLVTPAVVSGRVMGSIRGSKNEKALHAGIAPLERTSAV